MNVTQVLVDRTGRRLVSSNAAKLATLAALLPELVRSQKSELVVFPAGYLTAARETEIPKLVAAVAAEAKNAGVAVVFGIDLPDRFGGDKKGRAKGDSDKARTRASNKAVVLGTLPYWGCAIDANGAVLGEWRQQSVRSDQASFAPPSLNPPPRFVTIAGKRVAVLLCGELFNANYRSEVRAQSFDLLLDIGHESMAAGVIPSLVNVLGGQKRWAIHTHHVKVGLARALAVDATGANVSAPSIGQWRGVPTGGYQVFATTRSV